MGNVNAYRLVVLHGHNRSLNFLWGMEGALRCISWLDVPSADRERLEKEVSSPSMHAACSA